MLRTESRSQPRITTRITVESVGPTLNVSAGGMCVLMADPWREGMVPRLSFSLPDDPVPITCRAQIVWCRTSKIDPDLYEVGLSFTEISDEDRQRVMDFVAAHMSPQA
ncbi:MAG TPA: PilZ domain-containing protein [Phycisphaerae bacterium]|jgi:c-di-GMP-binding flagellar brake protein YcgR|nr:PilZ domain-containing protein [Phycisphaerae bacterium]HUX16932.1 PilZ domain-containing protein [Phycisphaerae bacterium]